MSNPNWAQVATAIIAFAAFWGAVAQLMRSRRAERRASAFGYFERWSAGDAVEYHAKLAETFVGIPPEQAAEMWDEFHKKSHRDRLEALVFMNFYEELGGLYNSGLVDRKVVRKFFGAAVVDIWERASWFIDRARAENPRTFDQWKAMYEDVKDRRDRAAASSRRDRMRGWIGGRRKLRRQLAAEQLRHARVERELMAAVTELRATVRLPTKESTSTVWSCWRRWLSASDARRARASGP